MSEPTPQTIQLHPAQRDFLQSEALYRAFCGGIGSGKSWAGSYDMIRRAKSGRLYMVIAPTYSMLADSTFRVFVALAEELGVAAEVRRSAPPSVILKTGAEVLFRSADEPDRLRGPNLSGIWLDEASLMPKAVFDVAIGRLREGGEQGWLTATFTPKGKGHWTFSTFAAGQPDAALFHAKTADNPFLPPGFHDKVRGQYTSFMAGQELEGLFLDSGGAMFQPAWFLPVVDKVPPLAARVRAWDLAATARDERKAHDPDYTVGLLMGKTADNSFIMLDIRRIRGTPQQVQQLVRTTAENDGRETTILMEQEPGSSGKTVIDHYARLLAGFPFHGQRSTGSKADRAQPLAASAEGGLVKLTRAPWIDAFLDEAEMFPFGPHDDQIDAASLAFARLARPQWNTCEPPTMLTPPRVSPYHDAANATGYDDSGDWYRQPLEVRRPLASPPFCERPPRQDGR